MFIRVRIAIGFALAAILMISIPASAKGGFDFITITGPRLKEPLQVTDTRLTKGFFTFANFYEDKTEAPGDPGPGYEITRHYKQGIGNIVFDRLHYYPESGFVFYDGIENGDSEYDGEWYIASPDIRTIFDSVLMVQGGASAPAEKEQPITSGNQLQLVASIAEAKPVGSSLPSVSIIVVVLTVGLAALLAFASWRRKPSAQ